MAAFSSRVSKNCRALRIAAEMTKFQIVIWHRPSGVSRWTPGGLSGKWDNRSTYRRNSSSIVNGFSYEQRTKKVTTAIAMTANWKKDVELEDGEIRQGIR